ncbi:MAG: N-glycosylase/DNA lyase [Candidatus Omnitrophica bacterium]|jgi:N-glycosylase/DNA lyase|nr:N-glycosylase/DNA lyase [Candidatus Omnitrophota bacterium]
MSNKETLIAEYRKRKTEIKERLREFREVWSGTDERIFAELCFCICTPQSKAVHCDKAISGLVLSRQLYCADECGIRKGLKAVRFPNNKARYIVDTRGKFMSPDGMKIKERLSGPDIFSVREGLVRNVKGIGYKEASHFLRNIGLGEDLAILDVHILKNMVRLRLIKEKPGTITRKKYLELEDKLRQFSKKIGIPMGELDLLFWAMETGYIFK